MKIPIKTKKEIEVMALGGKYLANCFNELGLMVEQGRKTIEFENRFNELILKIGGKPSFKGQGGFPFSICASLNEEIVHGLPSQREVEDGDILSLDAGIFFPLNVFLTNFNEKDYPNLKNGFHTDMARSFAVGEVDDEVKRLLIATKKTLKIGVKKVRSGITIGDLGETMQRFSEKQGFAVVRDLCGHGIGRDLHEDPQIPNYGERHQGIKLEKGMVICIEPMLTMGDFNIKIAKDGFTFKTRDDSMSAHFEDMMVVEENGVRLLTKI